MPTAPGKQRTRGRSSAPDAPRLTLVVRNRAGSEVTPALVRRLAMAFADAPIEILIADETIKMPSTELVTAARLEHLNLRVVRARFALSEALAAASAPYVAIADADDRHPPELLLEMLFEAETRDVDIVLATRRARPPRLVEGSCGAAVRGISDPLTTYFVARSYLVQGLDPKPGATVMALDVLLRHPRASVSELPVRIARPAEDAKPGMRRRVLEAAHVARLLRSGARGRAHGARVRARNAAIALRAETNHPLAVPALVTIIAVAALLRFWALPSLHWFGQDEAHASMAAYRLLVQHKPVLQGQPTSRGVYLGPGYYYLVAPFYLLFGMSPFAGAFLAAVAGVLAVYLTYRIGREIFGAGAGLFAAAVLATAPIAVYFGRFGWNPNTLPFFASLFIFSLIKARSNRRWLAAAAFCAGLAPQLHASGLILSAAFVIWLVTRRPRMRVRSWLWMSSALALPLLPLIAGELRNHFTMTKSWIKLLIGHGTGGTDLGGSVVGAFKDVFVETIGTTRFTIAALLVLLSLAGLVLWERKHWNDRLKAPAFQTVLLVQIVGLAGALMWRGQMFGYWLLPWLPGAVVLFAGGAVAVLGALGRFFARARGAVVASVAAAVAIAAFNVVSVAHPTRLANQFDAASPAAFQNVSAASEWIAAHVHGTFELQVWTPYAWDTAHNSTLAFDYLLLQRHHLAARPGGATIFIVAMEDVTYPRLRTVRAEVLTRYVGATHHQPLAAQDFGGLTVFELAR